MLLEQPRVTPPKAKRGPAGWISSRSMSTSGRGFGHGKRVQPRSPGKSDSVARNPAWSQRPVSLGGSVYSRCHHARNGICVHPSSGNPISKRSRTAMRSCPPSANRRRSPRPTRRRVRPRRRACPAGDARRSATVRRGRPAPTRELTRRRRGWPGLRRRPCVRVTDQKRQAAEGRPPDVRGRHLGPAGPDRRRHPAMDSARALLIEPTSRGMYSCSSVMLQISSIASSAMMTQQEGR